MLVEEDDDAPDQAEHRLAFLQGLEEKQLGVTPARLQRLMAMKEITYHMKSRKEKMDAKIEQLFRQKREQLYQIRLRKATITATNGYATIGNEYMLRQEILSQIEAEKKKQNTVDDDPYNYQYQKEHLRRIRERIVNRRDPYDGRAIIHCATAGGHFHIVRMLCHEFQVDVNVATILGRTTPLHLAIEKRFRQIASFLITLGADVNSKDDQGNSPLHLVTKSSLAKLLLKFGADAASKNRHNRSPYEHYNFITVPTEIDNDLLEFLREEEDKRNLQIMRKRVGQEKVNKAKDQIAHPLVISANTSTTESRFRRDLRAKMINGK
jgi:hypothetical protein